MDDNLFPKFPIEILFIYQKYKVDSEKNFKHNDPTSLTYIFAYWLAPVYFVDIIILPH